MTSPSPEVIPRRSADVASVERPGRAALVDLRTPTVAPIVLLDTAADIWSAVDGRSTVREIVGRMAAEYGVAADSIAGDVSGFLTDLEGRGLVTRATVAEGTSRDGRG